MMEMCLEVKEQLVLEMDVVFSRGRESSLHVPSSFAGRNLGTRYQVALSQ
jgi:hypothetical protein